METKEILEHKTDFYYIKVDKGLNLMLVQPIGFWSSDSDVSGYLPSMRNAMDNELTDGFNVICDLSEMKSASKEIRDNIHAQAGLEVMNRNVGITVMVSPESAITRMQIEALRKAYIDKPIKQVSTVREAYSYIQERS